MKTIKHKIDYQEQIAFLRGIFWSSLWSCVLFFSMTVSLAFEEYRAFGIYNLILFVVTFSIALGTGIRFYTLEQFSKRDEK